MASSIPVDNSSRQGAKRFRDDRLAGALLIDEIDESAFALIFEFVWLKPKKQREFLERTLGRVFINPARWELFRRMTLRSESE
jgi:hypothetical protein